ncbi:uncharacterized protein LOC132798097 [Drosophila nasuta]|uniref:uncharacterized protein LOC132798097 n=1 Tax=Drosophila nasuta TaxID=42062 RepID=UPI00295EB6DF|nr:uncharacterized protein LOC132798097 [Drosophila nasuta]
MSTGNPDKTKTRLSKKDSALRASSTSPIPARSASVSPTSGTKPLILVTKPPSVPSTKAASVPVPRLPIVTRSHSKMAHNVVDSALNKFIAATDRVSHFASRLNNAYTDSASLYTCQVRRDQMRALWDKVEKEYEACSCVMSDEMTTDELPTIQAKYDYCYIPYEQWSAQLSEQIADASQAITPRTPVQPQAVPFVSTGCRLPPCDTEVFGGDYTRWPTFRDLFTAIYIRNPRLQLRILFNLPAIGQESGAAIQELQSTIQGCLTALEHSKINTENWDCILVFLCSSRLPKLTLSLWEQSIQNKSDVPTWADMNAFLLERYRTLEAIAEVSASTSAPTVPRASRKEAPSPSSSGSDRLGSEATFLSEKLFKRLRMPYTSVQARVSGLTQAVAAQPRKFCQFLIGSRSDPICRSRRRPSSWQTPNSMNKSDVPTWADMNAFLLERYRTLEAIAEVSASTSAPTVPRASRKEAPSSSSSGSDRLGSEATFLSEKLFKRLRMPYTSVQARVSGLTQAVAAQPRKFCQFLIGSPVRPDLQIEASAYVLPQLAGNLPSCSVPQTLLENLPSIQLADPKFHESSQIDVLLGADILPSILLGGSHPNICGTLLGQETIFGWILTGPVSGSISRSISSFSARLSVERTLPLEELLSKFWEVEDLPASPAKI